MTATLDDEMADLRHANAELQQRLDERTAERDEGEAQKAAIAEILEVINASGGNLVPVFEAIVEKAHVLCDAASGSLQLWDGEKFRGFAMRGFSEEMVERLRIGYSPADMPCQRIVEGERVVHCADLAEFDSPTARLGAEVGGVRTILYVALREDDALLGQIVAVRKEVRPFSDKEIALVENFAAQAVIAMENARLITETREALDQQTATAEILAVINSSPGDLAPVFDAMLEKAIRLCEAAFGVLFHYDDNLMHLSAMRGLPIEDARWFNSWVPDTGSAVGDIVQGASLVHVPDIVDTDAYRAGIESRVRMVEVTGARTALWVALRKDEALLGVIVIYRREVRPFSDKQIALLQNFAAQAVIAMENARLITETREALEQQTATAEVLQVINSSPGDLVPVFDAMLEKATRLCEAASGILWSYDGMRFRAAAQHGLPFDLVGTQQNDPNWRPTASLDAIVAGQDLVRDDDLTKNRGAGRVVELGGMRTGFLVALRKGDALLGAIRIFRQDPRPFTDKQIALVRTFADQAVIAIENARLLDEIRQRQAELRVTFDNMADGVVMFDGDLRLAAWNRNFQELLDLPDAVLADRPSYANYLRMLAERGEFGAGDIEAELNRRLEQTDQEIRLERTRPDGRVIEVRRNAVQDGGFVLIYADITERKRSEGEIRAARDAAEAAYRDLKAAQANLVQAEKMASLGQLTAGIAHEIKNPLNFVNNFASLSVELLDELKETAAPAINALGDDKRAEIDETIVMLTGNLEKIAEHGRRADNIVKSMLEHSRGVTGERREVDINSLIEEALNLAYHGARAQDQSFNITLERDFDTAIAPIELAPQEMTRVCLNLFGNGFYAANKRARENGDGSFRPILVVATRDLGDAVQVRVRDNGTGIPLELRDKLFQPFFTTKPTGEGTGLGLSISYDIVTQQHGGTITVDSRVGEFTEFAVRLPRAYRATAATGGAA